MSSTNSTQSTDNQNQDPVPRFVDAAAALSVAGDENSDLHATAQPETTANQRSATIKEREKEVLELGAEITLRGNELDEWEQSLSKIQEGLAAHATRLFDREKAVAAREEAVKKREGKLKDLEKAIRSHDREFIVGDLLAVKMSSGLKADKELEQKKALRKHKEEEAGEVEMSSGSQTAAARVCTGIPPDSTHDALEKLSKLTREELDAAWSEEAVD